MNGWCIKSLGPGLLERVYEKALAFEFQECDLRFETQVPVDVDYKGVRLGIDFRTDVIVENKLVLEVKAVRTFDPIYTAQLITYLKLLSIKRGLLLNLYALPMKNGIKRISI